MNTNASCEQMAYQIAYLSGWVQGGVLVISLCAMVLTAFYISKLCGWLGQ